MGRDNYRYSDPDGEEIDVDIRRHEGAHASRIHLRGFGSMDLEKQREISSKGGRAAHEKGVAHEWNREEARAAGSKGGKASHANNGKKS